MTLSSTLGGRTAGTTMDNSTWLRRIEALKVATSQARNNNWSHWAGVFAKVASECELGLEVEGL